MLRVNQLSGFNAGGVETPKLTLLGTRDITSRGNPVSSGSISAPNPYTGRFLVAAISLESSSNFSLSGVTFNGTSASVISTSAGFFGGSIAALAWAVLSTGSTVNISATTSQEASGSFGLFEMTGQKSNTPIASGADNNSPYSVTLTGSAEGDLLFGAFADYGPADFAGITGITGFSFGADTGQGAYFTGVAAQPNQAVSWQIGLGYFSYPTFAAACWR